MLPDEGPKVPDEHRLPDELAVAHERATLPLGHRGVVGPVANRTEPVEHTGWAAAGWFMLLVVAVALAWSLSLPVISPGVPGVPTAHQVFRLEWFLTSTALGYVVWLASRSSWRVAVPSIVLASLQVVSIADEGAHRLHTVGVATAETDLLYVAAALQVVVFVAVGVSGMRRDLADRRWARLVAQLGALDPSPRRQDR